MLVISKDLKYCHNCLNNGHVKVEMKPQKVFDEYWEDVLLVCPVCGSTKSIR
ncbi:MAG: hypothetical protein RMJ17_04450 [Candidatus Aenigmarchaeota archaeon]|nr:hypothetical protein [Candidatus Aenigmarchaeota archaeon]MDW8149806.1 hypothetical protein [Candidatus Aenigmarchaeota archaeon]